MSQDHQPQADPKISAGERTARLDTARLAGAQAGPPRVIGGRYELQGLIGEGGAARVYRARDGVLDRIIAVKLLRDEYGADQEFVARFYREARAVASLSHPNIVDIYDYGAHDGTYFIAMQYIEGTDLKSILRREGRLAPARAIGIVDGALRALGAAHERGIIHRDVKPQNLLVRASDGLVKLTDFGVARAIGAVQVTAAGTTFGTAHYMAPEQSAGGAIGPATDLYAVGVVLFEALTGRLPFEGDTPLQIALQHQHAPPPAVTEFAPDVPPGLARVVERALAKDPLARFSSAQVMRQALDAALADVPRQRAAAATTPLVPLPAVPSRRAPLAPVREEAGNIPPGPPPGASRPAAKAATARRGGLGCVLPLLGVLILLLTAALVVLARNFGSAPRPEATAVSGVLPEPTGAAVALASPTATATPPPPTPTPRAPTAVPTEVPAPVVVPPTATHVPPTATPLPPTPKPPAPTQTPAPKPAPTATPTTPAQGNGSGGQPQSGELSPYQLQGAYRRDDGTLYGLPEVALYGEGSGFNEGTVAFTLQLRPGEGAVLVLTGLDDERNDHCRLQVVLNGVAVFDGPNTFRNVPPNDNGLGGGPRYWNQMTIPLPPNALHQGRNTLTLRNRTPGAAPGIPYILISAIALAEQP
jgi:tRNA A-37 threonylcarbamoyl transferase component Bud32